MTKPVVYVESYRPWRLWFRKRYRTDCQVCGERTTGHRTWNAGVNQAYRHLAWHDVVNRVLFEWTRDE